jgi:molecular chaperone HscB
MRMNKKIGEDDPSITRDLQQARSRFEQKMNELGTELKSYWDEWDALIPAGEAANATPEAAAPAGVISQDQAARERARDKMVDLLNRRSYIRNLLKDVGEALSS